MLITKRSIPFIALLSLLFATGLACSLPGRLLSGLTPESVTATATTQSPVAEPTSAAPLTPVPQPEQKLSNGEPEVTVSPTAGESSTPGEPGPEAKATPEPDFNDRLDPLASFERLTAADSPERDDLELARLYGGWDGLLSTPVAAAEPLAEGAVWPFRILNHDDITYSTTPFELLAVSNHAYFWFSEGPAAAGLSNADLEATGRIFDDIYERSVAIFGPENIPGVDGDRRLHIANAGPELLCADPDACGLAGYFSGDDLLPTAVDADSNAREMFVMNADFFGSDFYLNVLAHELRHMIEDNYDRGDTEWEGEGSAMLTEDLLGYSDSAVGRANRFLAQPDQQLNAWTDGDTIPHYGQGYLFNRYIYDRLGPELYRQFAASPATGLAAIDQVATANGLELTGHQLWLDWLVAMALIDHEQIPADYQLGAQGLDAPAMTAVERYPAAYDETVHQYAADYYHLTGNEELTIIFGGAQTVPVLDSQPYSGEAMWLANRANNSHARLTRSVDLTGVDQATLAYNVYHDIESGYDFAYVFVSQDDGQSWSPLAGQHMQGPESDPSGSALAERFYSGRSDGWRQERIDLSPYAGQQILIRFAYLTDMALTFGGLALDDIAVPEIDFYDDGESAVEGWTAEGFERVTGMITQQWQLQLITFADGRPQVTPLPVAAEQALVHTLPLAGSDGGAILIVSARAPMTLQPAAYQLTFQAN